MTTSPLITVMSAAAIKAGKGLLRDFGEVSQLQVSKKGPANFVTKSDLRTEKLLRAELAKARPNFGFLLEEGGEVAGRDSDFRWIIDPLDGTSNFIHALPYFCISIGLEQRRGGKSELVAGVVFDPIHNELFAAEKNKGAFVNSRRLAVSGRESLEDSIIATNNLRRPMKECAGALALMDTLMQKGATVRNLGATALDLAYVAAGRLDAAWYYNIQPWDLAAGFVLLREAGGMACELSGAPASAMSKTLLASNASLFAPMQSLFAKAA